MNTYLQILMQSLKKIFSISKRELRTAFTTPIAYTVIIIFLLISGYFFWVTFFLRNQATMRGFFDFLPLILTFVVPAYTMRSFAEEIDKGSYEMLATLPFSVPQIIIGKFFSSLSFIIVMLVPTLLYAISIEFVSDLDWGPIIGGYLGVLFLGGVYSAIGIFTSTLTKDQITAFILSVVICFSLYIIQGVLAFFPNSIVGFFQHLSTGYHFQSISKGVVDFRDVIYFISMIFVFLYAAFVSINKRIYK
jgi:gliding motility-associated transport system permease protein